MKRRTAVLALIVFLGLAWTPGTGTGASAVPSPPSESHLPSGELGEMIKLGKTLVNQTNTRPLAKEYVGNDLRCSSCHLNGGADPKAATFIGVATAYPAYSPREQTVITLEGRVANCFMRSMNGTHPPLGSKVLVAITTYITWLSQGLPLEMNPSAPLGPYSFPKLTANLSAANPTRGEELYKQKCGMCHGQNGEGVGSFPPVWGPKSYNAGAGLAEPAKLAAWLKVAMPPGGPDLNDLEAMDLGAYVDSQPRPRFVLRDHLPPADRMGVYNSSVLDEVRDVRPLKKP